jgi:hypothetical protein
MTEPRFSDEHLSRLRGVGDEPADAVARGLLTAYGVGASDETAVVAQAVRAVALGQASPDDAVLKWLSEGPGLPGWADPEMVLAGQRFFGARPMPIATALLCAALPTTFAAPHGAATLLATSQLRRHDQIASRLAATARMVFDALDDAPTGTLLPGNQGYLSVRGVRLLHAVVRQALLSHQAPEWQADHGLPINQEDLLGTLMAFTITVLDGLAELGLPASDAEAEAYVHAWCVIGSILGIDDAVLPIPLGEARDLARRIAGRQLRSSEAGRQLGRELLREMRLAMPTGCRGLPLALLWRLVPDVALVLRMPYPSRLGVRGVDAMCSFTRSATVSPWMRRVATGPVAMVGRSVLQMYIDREMQPGGPPYRLQASALHRALAGGTGRSAELRANRRRRRGDVIGVGTHVGPTVEQALAALGDGVEPPVDVEDVRHIASRGFPLWEPVDAMILRNRRITAGYADLSERLARVLAGPGAPIVDANWCTFATWSSKTIGAFIEAIPPTEGDGQEVVARPGPIPGAIGLEEDSLIARLARWVVRHSDGSCFRVLAAGQRVVFLEIGLAVTAFVDCVSTREALRDPAAHRELDAAEAWEDEWDLLWETVERRIADVALLDPSWLLTPAPPPDDLRHGLRQYFESLRVDDPALRSQYILAGNIFLAAYEQRRVDGYVWAALALFSHHAMRRLICDRTGAVGGVRRWPSNLYARIMTARMVLLLPDETVMLGRPVKAPTRPEDRWHGLATDGAVTLPVLQSLITRYQLSIGGRPNRGANNWTSYDQRMSTVGSLFRLRQRQASLFDDPFRTDDGA